jgi:alkylated DNA nucleotide flippase Atl1
MRKAAEPGLPCHRVIAAGGRLGGFGRSPALKRSLLAAEGLRVTRTRVVDFAERRWHGR